MKSTDRMLCFIGLAFLLAMPAKAAVTITNTQSGAFVLGAGNSINIPYTVTNPNSVVVVGFYFDNNGVSVSDLNFGDGGAGNQAAEQILTQSRASLGYFFNPSTSVSLTINGTSTSNPTSEGYIIWELAGVDLSAAVQTITSVNNTTSLTTDNANEFIISFLGVNNPGQPQDPDSTDSVLIEGVADFNVGGGGGGQIAGGHANALTVGTYQLGWASGTTNYSEIALSFEAIPEPGSLALLGLAAGFLTLRRRRAGTS